MTIKNKQVLKRLTYVGLYLTSMIPSTEVKSAAINCLEENSGIEFEKRPRLLFEEYETNFDDIHKELKSPPMGKGSTNSYKLKKNYELDHVKKYIKILPAEKIDKITYIFSLKS